MSKEAKKHEQEDIHQVVTGYKRMRQDHQRGLVKLEEKCRVEMENHKHALDKEYETLLMQFSKELEKLRQVGVFYLVKKVFFWMRIIKKFFFNLESFLIILISLLYRCIKTLV